MRIKFLLFALSMVSLSCLAQTSPDKKETAAKVITLLKNILHQSKDTSSFNILDCELIYTAPDWNYKGELVLQTQKLKISDIQSVKYVINGQRNLYWLQLKRGTYVRDENGEILNTDYIGIRVKDGAEQYFAEFEAQMLKLISMCSGKKRN